MAVHLFRFITLLLASLLVAAQGCGEPDPLANKINPDELDSPSIRIVSLSPALTQMVMDLGRAKLIVGVDDSHETVFEKALDVPTVGTYANVRGETIHNLKPTHVITMVGAEGPPDALLKLASSAGFKLVTFPYPNSVTEVLSIMIGESAGPNAPVMAENSLAHMLGDVHSVYIANEMLRKLGQIGGLTDTVAKPGQKPRVLVVFMIDPRIQASGPNTVFDDVLTKYAGAYNAAIPDIRPISRAEIEKITDPEERKAAILAAAEDPAKNVGPAPEFDREKLLEAKPDVILLVLPGEPPLKPIDEDPRLDALRGLDIPAVKNNRVVLISDKTAQLPSTGLPRVAAEMAKAIHPSLADKIDAIFADGKPKDGEKPAENKDAKPDAPETKDAKPETESKDAAAKAEPAKDAKTE